MARCLQPPRPSQNVSAQPGADMDEINTQLLIALVEQRPVIWDKTLDTYKDRKLKEEAWREVCASLRDDFQLLAQKQRKEFGKLVVRKWSQTRDSWMKSVRKYHEQKTSTFPARPSRLYLYHKQLSFLRKFTDTSFPHEASYDQVPASRNVTNEASGAAQDDKTFGYIPKLESTYGPQRKRKTEIKNDLDMKMTVPDTPPCRGRCGCRHMAFFSSLLPSMASLDDAETLVFQSEVLSILQNIKRKRSGSS